MVTDQSREFNRQRQLNKFQSEECDRKCKNGGTYPGSQQAAQHLGLDLTLISISAGDEFQGR